MLLRGESIGIQDQQPSVKSSMAVFDQASSIGQRFTAESEHQTRYDPYCASRMSVIWTTLMTLKPGIGHVVNAFRHGGSLGSADGALSTGIIRVRNLYFRYKALFRPRW